MHDPTGQPVTAATPAPPSALAPDRAPLTSTPPHRAEKMLTATSTRGDNRYDIVGGHSTGRRQVWYNRYSAQRSG